MIWYILYLVVVICINSHISIAAVLYLIWFFPLINTHSIIKIIRKRGIYIHTSFCCFVLLFRVYRTKTTQGKRHACMWKTNVRVTVWILFVEKIEFTVPQLLLFPFQKQKLFIRTSFFFLQNWHWQLRNYMLSKTFNNFVTIFLNPHPTYFHIPLRFKSMTSIVLVFVYMVFVVYIYIYDHVDSILMNEIYVLCGATNYISSQMGNGVSYIWKQSIINSKSTFLVKSSANSLLQVKVRQVPNVLCIVLTARVSL